MVTTPESNRLHIVVAGRRNAGKSTLVNALAGQEVSVVSPVAGTTTDPVRKPMELWPLGPVLLIDTPGLDDEGELGAQRVERARHMMERADIALLVVRVEGGAERGETGSGWEGDSGREGNTEDIGEETKGDFSLEIECAAAFAERGVPVLAVVNVFGPVPKEGTTGEGESGVVGSEKGAPAEPLASHLAQVAGALNLPTVTVNARTGTGLADLRELLVQRAPTDLEPPTLASHLMQSGDSVLLVAPQDIQAPKGRLILPQQQVLRDLLDAGVVCTIVRASELTRALSALAAPPELVITDSQVFGQVHAALPPGTRLSSFSVLMARQKGDMTLYTGGAEAIDALRPGDAVLIAEACSHQPLDGDIGRVKLPAMLKKYVGGELDITVAAGADFPQDLTPYKLVIHCGGCMFNRRHVLSRVLRCQRQGVPVTNYGIAIAKMQGILGEVIWE